MARCIGIVRATGEQCKNNACHGRDYCAAHHKNRPIGTAHPNFKHGKRSKFLIPRLQETYQEALQDEKLLELTDEIALLDTRINELLKMGESGKRWEHVEDAWNEVNVARRGGDANEFNQALDKLRDVVRQGRRDWAHWDEVFYRVMQRGQLVSREHKHRVDNRMAVSSEQIANEAAMLLHIITAHIKDQVVLDAINKDITALIASHAGTSPERARLN